MNGQSFIDWSVHLWIVVHIKGSDTLQWCIVGLLKAILTENQLEDDGFCPLRVFMESPTVANVGIYH